jgi:hypothetical protein
VNAVYRHTITVYSRRDMSGCSLESIGFEADQGDAIADGPEVEEVETSELPEGVASFFDDDGTGDW